MPARLSLRRTLCVAAVAFVIFYIIWFSTRQPQQDANWQPPFSVLPEIRLDGDTLHISNLRDFRYDEEGNVTRAHYREGSYQLSTLKGVWFGLSHFGENGLAHAFASFEFTDGQFLAVSIEARLRGG